MSCFLPFKLRSSKSFCTFSPLIQGAKTVILSDSSYILFKEIVSPLEVNSKEHEIIVSSCKKETCLEQEVERLFYSIEKKVFLPSPCKSTTQEKLIFLGSKWTSTVENPTCLLQTRMAQENRLHPSRFYFTL